MKPLVIYHDNCADGFGAAFAAWLKLGNDAEYLPCQYGANYGDPAFPKDVHDREVYILDFSFPRAVMDAIFKLATRVVWLDHHKTAFEMWGACMPWFKDMDYGAPEQHHIELNNSKSGALLAWEYFHPHVQTPMLFRHLDDYDRWQFKIDGTKEFNKALWSYTPWSFEQWKEKFLPCDMGNPNASFEATAKYTLMRAAGAAILRAHEQNVQSVVKGAARRCRLGAVFKEMPPLTSSMEQMVSSLILLDGLAANCPLHLTSDVGHELATQSGTFGLCWCLSKEGMIAKCSLRSNGDYDVSAIAKALGGGGHKNAAGFEVPIATLLGWMI